MREPAAPRLVRKTSCMCGASVDQRRRFEVFFLEVLAAFFEVDFFAIIFFAFFAVFLVDFFAFFFDVLGAAFLACATRLLAVAGEVLRFCFRAGKSGASVAAASVSALCGSPLFRGLGGKAVGSPSRQGSLVGGSHLKPPGLDIRVTGNAESR